MKSTSTFLPITDFMIAFGNLIDKAPSGEWLNRQGFVRARKLLILAWLVATKIIILAYNSTFLTYLIQISYGSTIDTINDAANSGLPILIPKNSAPHWLVATDPRSDVKKLFKNSELFEFNGTTPEFVNTRWYVINCSKITSKTLCNFLGHLKELDLLLHTRQKEQCS